MAIQVLRWSALVFGVFYGFTHQSAIYSSDKKAAAQQEWDHKVKLIDQAKAKYAEKNRPAGSGDGGESRFVVPYTWISGGLDKLDFMHFDGKAGDEEFADTLLSVITNPDDPKFDLEKYLTKVAKDNP